MLYYGMEWQSLDRYMQFRETSTPATPPTNEIRQYSADASGISTMCWINDAGASVCLPTSAGTLVTGTGAAGRVAFWNGTSSLSSNSDLFWDNTNEHLGVGTITPGYTPFTHVITIEGTTNAALEVASTRADADAVGLGFLDCNYRTNAASHNRIASIEYRTQGTTVNQRGGSIIFHTKANAVTTLSDRGRIDSNGVFVFGGGLTQISNTQPGNIETHPPVGTAASIAHVIKGFGVAGFGNFQGRAARGTSGSPTATQADDAIARFSAIGFGTTVYAAAFRAAMTHHAAENWTDTAHGTYTSLHTTATGTTTTGERWRITSAGALEGRVTSGNTIHGGSASGDDLTLSSTSNATKGNIFFGTLSTYDQANDRLGIGELAPANKVDIALDATLGLSYIQGSLFGASTNAAVITARKTRGANPATHSALLNADNIGNYAFQGSGGTTYATSASIRVVATENFSETARGTELQFRNVANTTTTLRTAWTIQESGDLVMGVTTANIDVSVGTGRVFFVPTDDTDPTGGGGAATGRIAIDVGGNLRYIPYYT